MIEEIQKYLNIILEKMEELEFVDVANVIAGVCSLLAVLSTLVLVFSYLKSDINREMQIAVIRIIMIIPYYSINTYLSLTMNGSKLSHVFDAVRDLYEAFTLYFFFKLCVQYAGGEVTVGHTLENLGPAKHPMPLKMFPVEFNPGRYFLFVCKQVLCHFVIIKPIMTVVAVFLAHIDLYGDGEFLVLTKGYAWLQLANFVSFSVSFYFLLLFYNSTRRFIGPMRPVIKFFTVKTIVILVFWQAIAGTVLINYGLIVDITDEWQAQTISKYLQRFLLCVEMFLISLVLHAVFSTKDFNASRVKKKSFLLALLRVFDISDVLYDLYDCYRPANIFGKKFDDLVHFDIARTKIETTVL